MTRLVFSVLPDGTYASFRCMGHAGYAEAGQDIICSAVSMFVMNTVNSLEEISKDRISVKTDQEKGFLECRFLENPTEIGKAFMDSLVMGIRGVISEYGTDHVSIEIREVSRC